MYLYLKCPHKHLKPLYIHLLPMQWLYKLLTPSDHLLNEHIEGQVLNAEPMKNIYMNTQESHNCSDLFIFPTVARIVQLRVQLDGQVISRYETACVLPTKTNLNFTVSIIITKTSAHVFFFLLPNTYTVVSCMQEVKQLFCTVLFCVGSRADAGFTQL